jgi:hypothetical protein
VPMMMASCLDTYDDLLARPYTRRVQEARSAASDWRAPQERPSALKSASSVHASPGLCSEGLFSVAACRSYERERDLPPVVRS